ncbi:MAG: hypothetical protein ACYS9Y_14125, partial [Planctomycetota bacterium]
MSKKLLYLMALFVALGMAGSEPASGFDYSPYISDEFVLHWPDPTRAHPDIPLDFRFVAYEIHNSPLTWELINEPAGMTIDQDGNVDWTPTTGDIGTYNITVKVTRDAGGFIQRAFTLNVNTTDFIFVATNGSDTTGDGSLSAPYETLDYAMRSTTNGDGKTIYIRGGTYHEAYAWEQGGVQSPFRNKNFTAADPMEMRSYPGESAILDCDLNGHGLWYYDTSYAIFSNLEVREAAWPERGGLCTSGSQHIMMRDSVVRECHWSASNNCTGYKVQVAYDVIIDRCEAYNNNDTGNGHWNSSNYLVYTEVGPSGNIYIQNCLSQDSVCGFKIKHAGPLKLIVHNCVSIDDDLPYAGVSDYSSFRYSVAYGSVRTGIDLGLTDYSAYIGGPMLVEHMTIANATGTALHIQDTYLDSGSVIQNNIFYNDIEPAGTGSDPYDRLYSLWNYQPSGPPVTSNNNLFYSPSQNNIVRYGPTNYSFTGWQGAGHDASSVFDDPLFVDLANGDLNVPLNSPANFGGGEFAGAFAPGAGGPQPPGKATNPSPSNGATNVSVDADLSWTAGTGSTSSDVYFGTDSTPDAGEFQGNQTAKTYDPGTMINSTTYYWRIDEINAEGTTTGNVWSFTTLTASPPGQASNPNPADSATDVSIDADLSWTAHPDATSHDVYFGTTSPGTFQGNQTATTYDPGTMAVSTTYYWRIDEVNANGTTTGIVWSFTTGAAPPAFLQDSGADGIVSMEAENYDGNTSQGGHDWTLVTSPGGYTGTGAMEATPNIGTNQSTGYAANSPRLDFQVDFVKTGTHYVWIRGYFGTSGADDSIHAGLDGAEISTCDNISTSSSSYVWTKATMDGPDATFNVSSTGVHTVNAWMREDGFVFDKIVLTVNASYTPTGDGPAESPRSGGPTPPGQASNPSPADSATDVSVDADLSWTAGSGATSHDVYFGTTSPGAFQGNQTATTFEPGTMSNDTTYYWRIDEVNAQGTTTGNVWSFTTEAAPQPPGQASNPSPADSATDVSVDADLSWTAGSGATSHDVYFGTDSTPDPSEFQGNQTATTFEPGTMSNDTTYYWRIDEINAQGTTTGNVWSFTTIVAAP